VLGVDVSRDGKWAVSGGADATLRLWDVAVGKEVRKLEGHADWCRGLFSPDGKQILSFGGDKTLRLWDAESGKEITKIEAHSEPIYGAFFLPAGKQVLWSGGDKTAWVWDLATQKEGGKVDLGGSSSSVRGVALSPDGKRLLATVHGDSPGVRVLDLASGKEVHRFATPNAPQGVSFSPDGRLAASGSFRGLVYLWRLPDPAGKP
jgi:WD40 repeat protein